MKDHLGTLSQLTRDADTPAHTFHHSLDEIESEAHATNLIVPDGLGSIKGLENMRQVRGRNSDSFVLYADQHFVFRSSRRLAGADCDPLARIRIFYRVTHQIFDAGDGGGRISDDGRQLVIDFLRYCESCIAQIGLGRGQALGQDWGDLNRFLFVTRQAKSSRGE